MKTACCLLFAFASILPAPPPQYHTLVITSKNGKIPLRLTVYLESKFPRLKLETKDRLSHYKTRTDLPLSACEESEYYLLGPGNELLRKGCVDTTDLTTPTWQIDEALAEYNRKIGK